MRFRVSGLFVMYVCVEGSREPGIYRVEWSYESLFVGVVIALAGNSQ